ncbi:MAG: GrpB family protein [Myxococcaceae bacterium]
MPTPEEITRHHEPPPGTNPWVNGSPPPRPIELREYDETWPDAFRRLESLIRKGLGSAVLGIEHVGSTSVPGLPAKPVIDIDLTVADPSNEAAYIPALTEAGFVHVVREPWWHEHRCLHCASPQANLHVFGPACPEVIRHRMFRKWLMEHPEDFTRYRDAKRLAATEIAAKGGNITDYNRHKEPVLLDIYERMFRANGLLQAGTS